MATACVAAAGFGTSVALACADRGLIDQRQPPIVEMADGQLDFSSADSAR